MENDFNTKDMTKLEDEAHPFLMGKVSAVVNELKSATAIVDEIVGGAVNQLQLGGRLLTTQSRL